MMHYLKGVPKKQKHLKRFMVLFILTLTICGVFFGTVSAINFEGAINYVGAGGGNVTFNQNFVANSLRWVNGLNRFQAFRWAGNNRGGIGFDTDAGTNMTVLNVGAAQINYNISNPVLALSTQRVFYGDKGRPTITGGVITNYNDGTDIVTVTTLGDADVVLTYNAPGQALDTTAINLVGVFTVIAVALILTWQGGLLDTDVLITLLIAITLAALFAQVFG